MSIFSFRILFSVATEIDAEIMTLRQSEMLYEEIFFPSLANQFLHIINFSEAVYNEWFMQNRFLKSQNTKLLYSGFHYK